MVASFFSTQEHGLLLQDSFPKIESHEALLGLEVPYYYFSKKVKRMPNPNTIHLIICMMLPPLKNVQMFIGVFLIGTEDDFNSGFVC